MEKYGKNSRKIVTFGEAMIRLSPPNFLKIEQTTSLQVMVGGSELNVAVGLSRLGMNSAWVSRLPMNELGRLTRNKAREMGVDTNYIIWSDDERMGLYFVEYGASPRNSSVLYDRENSAISNIKEDEINWKEVLLNSQLFHVSGITPALSESCAEATFQGIKTAKEMGIIVSYDLNYRKKLWETEKACSVQKPYMEYVDILITTEEDTEKVFGIQKENFEEVAKQLAHDFSIPIVVITLRETPSVWRNTWSAIAYFEEKIYRDKIYNIELVDRVGGGDNFAAGFIYGYLTKDVEYGLKIGNAFSALKQTIFGDFNWACLDDVQALLDGSSFRISR